MTDVIEEPLTDAPEADPESVTIASPASAALAVVNDLYEDLQGRRGEIARLGQYFRGQHPLVFASDAWRKFHQHRYKDFSDNWCGVVASSPAERIRVNGFRIGDDTQVWSAEEQQMSRDWLGNDLDAQSSQGFLESIISKTSYVLVWGDSDANPVVTWEHPSQMIVDCDPCSPRVVRAALKSWSDDDMEYATLYLPDSVWKWKRRAGIRVYQTNTTDAGLYIPVRISDSGWSPRQERTDATWPLPNPMGVVPVVEVANRPLLGGEPMSDISGAACMQDAINLLWAYLFAAADHASLPARVVMGQEPPSLPILDANGQLVGTKPIDMGDLAKSRLLWLNGENTKIAQWEPAKLDVFTSVINIAVRHLAAQTRTPVHYIVGELTNVNGETLLAGESGLVKKVEEFQLFAGSPVRRIHALMAMARGNAALAEACRYGTVQWAGAETRTTAQAADAALKDRQLGMPLAWIAEKRFGLSQPEIARLLAMVEAEAADPILSKALGEISAAAKVDAAAAAAPSGSNRGLGNA